MAYPKFDPLQYQKRFNSMMGPGSFDAGISNAKRIGAGIGQAKLDKRIRDQIEAERKKEEEKQQRLLEQAAKEAAKKDRERQQQKDKEKKSGKKENANSKAAADLKRQIEASGGSTAKEQSAFGKWAHLNPDNNAFFDALDLLGRGGNAIMNIGKQDEKLNHAKTAEEKRLKSLRDKPIWETGIGGKMDLIKSQLKAGAEGFSGKKKTIASDVLKEAGMKKGLARGAAGFALDAALDPLNLVGGLPAKVVGKVAKTATAKKAGEALVNLPGVKSTAGIFTNSFRDTATLGGGKTDALQNINRNLKDTRSSMLDRSLDTVAKAGLQGGKGSGVKVGQVMEAPLSRVKPLDIASAPNVINSQSALDIMNPLRQTGLQNTDPFTRMKDIMTKTTDNGVFVGPTEKWGTRQFDVKAKVTTTLKSTKDVRKASEQLMKDPIIKTGIQRAATTLMESNADIRKFAEQNGISVPDLEGYMAHFATKEARKHLDDSGQGTSSGIAHTGGDSRVMKRNLKENVSNANKIMKKSTNIDQFFNPDAFTATAGGQQRVINFVVSEAAKKQILGNADLAKEIPISTKSRKGFVHMDIDGKRYEMTKGAATAITNFEKATSNDEGMNALIKGFDKLQNTWKKAALFSAGYHARNMIGNSFNMYVSGMNPASIVAKQTASLKYLNRIKGQRAGRLSDVKVPDKIQQQYDNFVSQGLRDTGQGADFMRDAGQKVMSDVRYRQKGLVGKTFHEGAEVFKQDGALGKLKQAGNAMFDTSKRLGDETDEVARFTLFRHNMDKGMTAKQAAQEVRKILFDYTDLTETERTIFKRLAPFYTFTRKNAEFQIKAFAKSPQRYNKLNMMINEGYANTDMNQDIVPPYMKDALAMPITGTNQLFNGGLPAADLSRMTDPGKMALDSLSPILKTPLEVLTNQKMLNGAPITTFPGENGKLFGKEFGGALGLDGKQWQYALESGIAPLRNLSGAQQQTADGAGSVNGILKAVGGQLTKPYDEAKFQNSADYAEVQRLKGIKDRMEKQDGKDVMTKTEMKKKGLATDEQEAADQKFLKENGYKGKQQDLLLSFKKKVYNGNAEDADRVRTLLEQMGIEQNVIDMITKDYLVY